MEAFDTIEQKAIKGGESAETITLMKEEHEKQVDSKPGCTDPDATNYDLNAKVDDGSCKYDAKAIKSISKKFELKPQYFGTGKFGDENKPNETKAVKDIGDRVRGLGLKVEKDKVGINAFKIISPEGEEDVSIGNWEDFWTMSDETNEQKADRVNNFINEYGRQLEIEDDEFDFDMYKTSFDIALDKETHVFKGTEEGGGYLEVDELDFDQLDIHMKNTYIDLMQNFLKSDEGQTALTEVQTGTSEQMQGIALDLLQNIDITNPKSLEEVAKEYNDLYSKTYDEFLTNHASILTATNTNGKVVSGLYDDKLREVAEKGDRIDEFGSIIGKSDFLTGLWRTTTLQLPQSFENMRAIGRSKRIEKAHEMLEKIKGKSGDEKIWYGYFEMGAPEESIPGQHYTINELRPMLQQQIQHHEFALIENLIKSEEYQEVLNKLPSKHIIDPETGEFNLTADNWQEAMGDQFSQMLFSIMSAGMTTMTQEAGEAYMQIVEGKAKRKFSDEVWNGMTKEDKANELFKIVDAGEADISTAMAVGSVNMALDNLSNYVFVGKMAGPAKKQLLKKYYELFLKGKYKKVIRDVAKNVNYKDITLVTLVEGAVEGAQEETMMLGVGTALDDYTHNTNRTLNAIATAMVTTPFLGAGTRTVSDVTREVYSKALAIRNPEGVIAICNEQGKEYTRLYNEGKVSEVWYDDAMERIDALKRGFGSNTHRNVSDREAAMIIFNEQLNILRNEKIVKKNKKSIKEDDLTEEEELSKSIELAAAENKIKKAKQEQTKARKLNSYKQEVLVLADKLNSDPVYKDWDVNVFGTTQDALDYMASIGVDINMKHPVTGKGILDGFIEGNPEFVLDKETLDQLGITYEGGKGVVVYSNENITNNINSGLWYSENAIAHGLEHVKMSVKSDEELSTAREEILSVFKNSKDPLVKQVEAFVQRRLLDYGATGLDLNSRAGTEEFFTAIGDVTTALSLQYVSTDASVAFKEIGEQLNSLLYGENATVNKFSDVENIFGFFSHVKGDTEIEENIVLDGGNPQQTFSPRGVLESIADGDQINLDFIARNNPYKQNRSNEEIDLENKEIAKKIIEAESYTNENKELQERVRAGSKVHRDKLLLNNFGAIRKLVTKNYKRDHLLHTKEKESEFVSAVLEQVSKAINTYNPKLNDSFGAYYFGAMEEGTMPSVAQKRVAKIWDDMVDDFFEQIDPIIPTPGPVDPNLISTYTPEYILDIHDQIDTYNERSALREIIPEMETGTPKYDAWINSVDEIMSTEIDNVFNEDFAPKLRTKFRNSNWKNLKKNLGGYNSDQYNNWVEDNDEFLYNRMPQKVMNESYPEFTRIVTERMGVEESRLQKDVKSDTAGNAKREKLPWNDEIKAAWRERLLKKDQVAKLKAEGLSNKQIHDVVRLDMAQEGFLKHLSDILSKDAVMQVIQSPEFVKEHGIAKKQIMEAAMRLDRGMNVKFSIKGTEQGFIDGNTNADFFMQETSRLIRLVEDYEESNEWELVLAVIEGDKAATQPIKDFVISLYDKDAVISAGEKYFKTEALNNKNISQETRDKFKDNGAIRFNSDAKIKMMDNANVMAKLMGKEFMDSVGFEFLGIKGGGRFLDVATRKQVSGWNNLTKEERAARTAKDKNARWQKDKEGNFIRGEFNESYTSLQETLTSKDLPDSFNVEDVRIMNKDYGTVDNSIFKQVIKILEKDISKKAKLEELESSGLSAQIEAANKANIEAFVHVSKGIAEQLKEGNLDEAGVLHMFQMQTNLAGGFRGLSRLDLMQVLNGSQKGTLWKGEHAQSMSETNSKVIDILFRYKNNSKSVNLDAELRAALAEYGQIIGDKKLFDKLDDAGKTNVSGINRLALLSFNEANSFTNISGENVRDIQARIKSQNILKAEVVKSQKRTEAKENIRLKNTKKGKVKGATVMDFDGTAVIGGKNIVYATNPKTGEKIDIPSDEFTDVVEDLTNQGYEFDFSDYINVKGGDPSVLVQKIKNQIAKYGSKDVHILTARQPEAAIAIQTWLKQHGVNLPIENITGLGVEGVTVKGEHKANWIEQNLILNGYNDIYFVDDSKDMVDAVRAKFNEYSGVLVEGGKAEIVAASKVKTDNKVLFMVGSPGSGKSTIIDNAKLGDNYTILNPDVIMEPLLKAAGLPLDHSLLETPEQRSAWGKIQSQAVKEFKQQIIDARAKGLGVVIDGTGASAKVMQGYYDAFQKAGYNIGAISVQTSVETALQRNADRERSLMDNIVIGGWDQVQQNIPLYKKMFGDNFFQVFTDDLTMNSVLPSDFVRGISNFTLTNPIIRYSAKGNPDLNKTFNDILETSTGIESRKSFSEAEGKIRGAKVKSIWDVMYPASAYDFEMFTYRYITDGNLGQNQKSFFQEKLFTPFEKANLLIDQAKQQVTNNYKSLIKELPRVRKNLNKTIEGTNFTTQQAIRVYLWNKAGFEIPGISKGAQKTLVETVLADPELIEFADKLSVMSQQKEGYLKPGEYWTVENIAFDLSQMTGVVGRAEYLKEWKTNVLEIFSIENKAKLRAAYGNDHVEALEDMLYRMEYGKNRQKPNRIETQWNNWVNNSVGAIMFFNMRSATLQTISAVNYIDWQDNNIVNATKALANVPQFCKDFSYIFNSDMLKQRRAGNKRTINEAELTARLTGSTNKAKAAIAYLLEKGFLPTQIADSFAISSGGATYYRNKIKAYEKQGLPTEEAEALAWLDFQEKTQKGQQSSRPDLISQQQAGGLGRLILAFKNTPMQYNRLMAKAVLDLKNNRGSTKENLSKIVYYGAVQNAIFVSLQTALWSALGDEDEWDNKKERVANNMIDGILNGMGLTGTIAATIKNGYLRYSKEKKKGWNADHTRTIIEFANMSPTIGSKLRKLYSSIRTEQMNEEAIKEMGFTIENPAFNAVANLISATTNIPLDRAVQKAQNLILASKSETEFNDALALTLGWNPWDIGIESTSRKAQKKFKLKSQKEREEINKEIKTKEKEDDLKPIIEKEKKEEKEGTKTIFNCSAVNKHGVRCSNSVNKAGQRCTVHQKVEEREDGKETKCKAIRTNGQSCNMMTASKSGLCVYHD